jgi:homoserine/homoserine lactone efflux protein
VTLRTWALFALTETALCFTPGVAVLYVIGSALRHGARASVASNLGILAGNAIYFALSAAGLGALLLASHALFSAVRWAGAAYLVVLGAQALLRRGSVADPEPVAAAEPPSRGRLFGRGVALQLANPKTLLFFVALLPQFIDPRDSLAAQVGVLGASSVAIEFCVLAFYGWAAGAAADRLQSLRWRRRLDVISGGFLVGAGLKLAGER